MYQKIEKLRVSEIIPYKRNNKKHPKKQIEVIAKSILENGYISRIVVDENNVVVAGHGRLQAIKYLQKNGKRGEDIEVIKLYGYTEKQIAKYRMIDNKSSDLGEYDLENIKLELDEIGDIELSDIFSKEIKKYLKEQAKIEGKEFDFSSITEEDLKEEEDNNIKDYKDIYFKSSNRFDIPDLLPNMLYDGELPKYTANGGKDASEGMCFVLYGNSVEYFKDRIICFYRDDDVFEKVWNDAIDFTRKIAIYKPAALCTPNFSIWSDEPYPYGLLATYKTQRCGRYRQEDGHKIIPTLNWGNEKSFEYCFLGLPKQIPIATIQARNLSTKKEYYYFYRGIQELAKNFDIGTLIVYCIKNKENFFGDIIKKAGLNCNLCFPGTRVDRKKKLQAMNKNENE